MLSRLLFGVQKSPFRTLCVVLAIVVVVMGIIAIPVLGPEYGLPVIVLGLLAVAVLSRQLNAYDERQATSAQLSRISKEYDAEQLRGLVEHSNTEPSTKLGQVTGQIDGQEIQAAIEGIRGADAGDGAGQA